MNQIYELGLNRLDILVQSLPDEGIIILNGDLASGKTTLVQEIARFHGVLQSVNSPTFSIMQSYKMKNSKTLFHYDIYQGGTEKLLQNGLFENIIQEDGLHLIEWGDDILISKLKQYNLPVLIIKISPTNKARKYEIYKA